MAKIGYCRVSTVEQNLDRQIKTLERYQVDKIFTDKLSGKDTNRAGLEEMLDYVRDGDTVYISEFSRLARSTKDLLDIIERLDKKGVKVISEKENLDTTTPTGELMLTVMAGIATFERKIMLERQREGIAVAKAKGHYKGRGAKSKPAEWSEWLAEYKRRRMTATELAKRCNVSRTLLYKWIDESVDESKQRE